MRQTLAILGDIDRRVALALVNTALCLTALEYVFLPVRVQARLDGVQPWIVGDISLEAGLIWAAGCVALYAIVPLVILRVVHRERPSSIGYRFKELARHVWIYLALFGLVLPFVLVASQRPGFQQIYPFVAAATGDWTTFLAWEAAYLAQFVALEAFFRGYLLFTLERSMGGIAVFVMTVPYAMIHFHKPGLEAVGAVIAGIALGALALRYRSWYGGAILHVLVAATMDSLAAHRAGLF